MLHHRKRWLAAFLLVGLTHVPGLAQITSAGLAVGFSLQGGNRYEFQTTDYLVKLDNPNTTGRYFDDLRLHISFFLEHRFLAKTSLSHNLTYYTYYPGYEVYEKTGGGFARAFVTNRILKYNVMVPVLHGRYSRILLGTGVDINLLTGGDYSWQSSAELQELLDRLDDSFRPLVWQSALELGYRAGRLDVAVRINQALTSFTGNVSFQGEEYRVRSWQTFVMLNFGYLVFDRELRNKRKDAKRKK